MNKPPVEPTRKNLDELRKTPFESRAQEMGLAKLTLGRKQCHGSCGKIIANFTGPTCGRYRNAYINAKRAKEQADTGRVAITQKWGNQFFPDMEEACGPKPGMRKVIARCLASWRPGGP